MRASVKTTAAAALAALAVSLAALAVSLAAVATPASAGGGTWHSGWHGAGIGWGAGAPETTGAAIAGPYSYEYGNYDGDYGANYYAFPACPSQPIYDPWGNVIGATSAC